MSKPARRSSSEISGSLMLPIRPVQQPCTPVQSPHTREQSPESQLQLPVNPVQSPRRREQSPVNSEHSPRSMEQSPRSLSWGPSIRVLPSAKWYNVGPWSCAYLLSVMLFAPGVADGFSMFRFARLRNQCIPLLTGASTTIKLRASINNPTVRPQMQITFD